MRQIVGYVLIKETNAPVSNVVVTAFDAGGAPAVMREKGPTAEVMRHVGRRISSVLTGPDGRFTFDAGDLEFAGNEPRPDLVAAVFAPEDIDNPAIPYPEPPEKRVLYMSVIPRIDAGAQEAFVIRLSRGVIADLHLDGEINQVANHLDRAWRAREAVSDELKRRHELDMERRLEARKIATESTKNLHAVPNAFRSNKFLVLGKAALHASVETKEGSFTRLAQLQHQLVDEGLKALDESGYKPTMRLHLTESDLKDLKLVNDSGDLLREVDPGLLQKKLLALTGGVDLVRRRGMDNPAPEQLEAKYLRPALRDKPVK